DRHGGNSAWLFNDMAGTVANALPPVNETYLEDFPFQMNHFGQFCGFMPRSRGSREGIAAVQGDSRAQQVVVILGAEKNSGGIGEAPLQSGKAPPPGSKPVALGGVERVLGLVGTGQMAHDEFQRDAVEGGIALQ